MQYFQKGFPLVPHSAQKAMCQIIWRSQSKTKRLSHSFLYCSSCTNSTERPNCRGKKDRQTNMNRHAFRALWLPTANRRMTNKKWAANKRNNRNTGESRTIQTTTKMFIEKELPSRYITGNRLEYFLQILKQAYRTVVFKANWNDRGRWIDADYRFIQRYEQDLFTFNSDRLYIFTICIITVVVPVLA